MTTNFEKQLNCLENNGPTAKLWIQYLKGVIVTLEAERLGNWQLHLSRVKEMFFSLRKKSSDLLQRQCKFRVKNE